MAFLSRINCPGEACCSWAGSVDLMTLTLTPRTWSGLQDGPACPQGAQRPAGRSRASALLRRHQWCRCFGSLGSLAILRDTFRRVPGPVASLGEAVPSTCPVTVPPQAKARLGDCAPCGALLWRGCCEYIK